MLAADARCKTLDASADGYGRAEAVGTVHLRAFSTMDSLSSAETSGHAVVLGAAINQDGRSSSLTAPNGPAQQALMRTALATAHLPPGKVAHLITCLMFLLSIVCCLSWRLLLCRIRDARQMSPDRKILCWLFA